jgi:hypothetical protein
MNTSTVTWLYPAPHSPLPITHPARSYDKAETESDIRRTFAAYRAVGDDFDMNERSSNLDMMMEFSK